MTNRTLLIAAAAVLLVAIAAGVAWKVSASRNLGPRPGVDIPLRGM